MDKLSAMRAFVEIVGRGGYAQAARAMGLTRSALSKAVAELEAGLGARLLDRTTRRVTPTEAGQTYYERCRAILAQVDETDALIARLRDEPRGLLRLNGPLSFGLHYLGDAVADFMARYPELRVELTLTDRFIDPLEEGVDVTIRIGELGDSSLVARRIGRVARIMAAAPAYLERRAAPRAPEDLASHDCLAYGQAPGRARWPVARNGVASSVAVDLRLCSNNGEVLRAAALRGLGVVQLPTFIIGADIAAGRLAEVLPDWRPPDLGIHALHGSRRFTPAKTRLLIDFLVERFDRAPPWREAGSPVASA